MMLPAFQFHEIARLSALRMVDSLIEGTAIGAFAVLVLRLRRQSASVRFSLWFSALMAVAVAPIALGLLNSQQVLNRAVHPAVTLPESWAVYLFTAWAAIAAWQLLALTRAIWQLRQLRATCVSLDCKAYPELFATLRGAGVARSVSLCCSDQVRVPTVIGLWNSAIVFPRWVFGELSAAELNQILLHELAHLRRRDDWTNLAQQFVKSVLFFHPAVWWIEKQVSLEREMACDDAVLEATASPRSYAETLAHLAEKGFIRRSVVLAQAALGKMRQTSLRVAQILDPARAADRNTNPVRVWRRPAVMVAGFAVVCAVCASHEPNLIAFQPADPPTVASALPHTIGLSSTPSEAPGPSSAIRAYDFMPTVPVTPASLKVNPVPRHSVLRHRSATKPLAKPRADSIVPYRLTSFHSDMNWLPFNGAVFFLVQTEEIQGGEGSVSQQPAIQIQWHLLVLRPAIIPDDAKFPPKQT